jgi:hypothetical protein
MAKFILLYKGPATPAEEMSPEQSEQVMAEWNAWMGKVGSAIVDLGNPFAAGTGVAGDGSVTGTSDLHGYTIIEAADLEQAQNLCDGHPFLSDGTAKFVVEVYELAPVPM